MPDFNKGDFTQQGVAGHVNANLRLNEKRLVNIDLTSNEEAEGCTITGTVKDLLNNKVYGIGSGVSGNIEITENGENINVAPYATATVNVSGGGGETFPHCKAHAVNNTGSSLTIYGFDYDTGCFNEMTLRNSQDVDLVAIYREIEGLGVILSPDGVTDPATLPSTAYSDLNNIELYEVEGLYLAKVIDPSATSSCTIDASFFHPQY